MIFKFFIELMIMIGVVSNEPFNPSLKYPLDEIIGTGDDTIQIQPSTIGTNKDERYLGIF